MIPQHDNDGFSTRISLEARLPHEVRNYAVGPAQLFTLSNMDGEMLALQDSPMNHGGQATEAWSTLKVILTFGRCGASLRAAGII